MNKPTQSTLFAIAFGILFELLTTESYNCAGILPATRIMVISTVYYSLIIGTLLIRLHSVIDSKVFFIFVIVSNLALNPLILYFFCLFFTSFLLTSDFLLFYAPVGNTLLFLFDSFLLLYCRKNRLPTPFPDYCQRCGKELTLFTAHCPHCYTISHKLNDTFVAFPDKHHLDFTEDIHQERKYCPHCGARKEDRIWFDIALVCPIQVCVNCRHFYLDNSCIEWALASLPRKCFVTSMYLLALSLSLAPLWNALSDVSSIRLRFIFIGIALLSLALVFQTLLKDISASHQRFKANPDYVRLLEFMGYQHLGAANGQSKKKDI